MPAGGKSVEGGKQYKIFRSFQQLWDLHPPKDPGVSSTMATFGHVENNLIKCCLHSLTSKKKKTFPLSFSPSLASLYLFEQWLRLGVTSTSSVWLPLQDESLYVFPNCKSLWIKASAKWLNVNVNERNMHRSCTVYKQKLSKTKPQKKSTHTAFHYKIH